MRLVSFALVSSLLLLAHGLPAWAAAPGCSSHGALVQLNLGDAAVPESGRLFLGSWFLPIRPGSESYTYARVSAYLLKNDGASNRASLLVAFDFNDPQGWGLPFTFEAIRVAYRGFFGQVPVLVDWSQNCSATGRSLFPGQAWEVVFDLGLELGRPTLESLEISVFGARN